MVSHPNQISLLACCRSFFFVPGNRPERFRKARAVVDAYERISGGVALLDGRLIERPVYLAAKRLLAAAELHQGEQ